MLPDSVRRSSNANLTVAPFHYGVIQGRCKGRSAAVTEIMATLTSDLMSQNLFGLSGPEPIFESIPGAGQPKGCLLSTRYSWPARWSEGLERVR